jgi:hypothetical protein
MIIIRQVIINVKKNFKIMEENLMAKKNSTETYSKATINVAEGTITEYLKDETNVYRISDILDNWNGVEGVTLTIKKDDTIKPIE